MVDPIDKWVSKMVANETRYLQNNPSNEQEISSKSNLNHPLSTIVYILE